MLPRRLSNFKAIRGFETSLELVVRRLTAVKPQGSEMPWFNILFVVRPTIRLTELHRGLWTSLQHSSSNISFCLLHLNWEIIRASCGQWCDPEGYGYKGDRHSIILKIIYLKVHSNSQGLRVKPTIVTIWRAALWRCGNNLRCNFQTPFFISYIEKFLWKSSQENVTVPLGW